MSNEEIKENIDKANKRYYSKYYDLGYDKKDGSQECWLYVFKYCKTYQCTLENLNEKQIKTILSNALNNYKDSLLIVSKHTKDAKNDPVISNSLNLQKSNYYLNNIDTTIKTIMLPRLFKEHSKERKYVCYKLVLWGLMEFDSLDEVDKQEFICPTTDDEYNILKELGYSFKNNRTSPNMGWINKKQLLKDLITKYIYEN